VGTAHERINCCEKSLQKSIRSVLEEFVGDPILARRSTLRELPNSGSKRSHVHRSAEEGRHVFREFPHSQPNFFRDGTGRLVPMSDSNLHCLTFCAKVTDSSPGAASLLDHLGCCGYRLNPLCHTTQTLGRWRHTLSSQIEFLHS